MKKQFEVPVTKASFGFLLNSEGKVLLVANDYAERCIMWGLPGGGIEDGENPEICVVREFREEVGIEIEVVTFVGVIERFKPEWELNLHATFFAVKLLSGEARVDPNEEHVVGFEYCSISDIKAKQEMVLGRNRIVEYLVNPQKYPAHIIMTPDEE